MRTQVMADDDDFGEFGGFEAAEPSTTAVAAPVSATNSPWAVFPPVGNTTAEWPGTEAETKTEAAALSVSTNDVTVLSEDSLLSENSSQPLETTPADSIYAIDEKPLRTDGVVDNDQESSGEQAVQISADSWIENLKFPSTTAKGEEETTKNDTENSTAGQSENFYLDQIKAAQEEKSKLERDLKTLRDKRAAVETDLLTCQEDLRVQKEKYEELQKKHMSELEAMRKTGMDALAVIVEEYKELCKVVVIEQQEACEKQLKVKLDSLTEQCQSSLEEQNKRLWSKLEEELAKQEALHAEALSKQQHSLQSTFEEAIENEKIALRDVVSKAMEEQKKSNEKAVVSAIETLKSENQTILAEQKIWLTNVVDEKLEVMKDSVLIELDQKRQESETALKKVLLTESESSKEQILSMADKTREETMDLVRDLKQADNIVRQRQLSSLQLFLETAKSQVSELISEVSDTQKTSAHSL